MAAVVGASLHNILMDAYDFPYSQGHGGEGSSNTAPQSTYQFEDADQMELSDYNIMFDDQVGSVIMPPLPTSSYQHHHGMDVVAPIAPIAAPAGMSNSIDASALGGAARKEETTRIAFRVKSEDFEVLEDGYKWRKYGKKSVKNSPNPRNYYKCSTERCLVKKRVERDKEDPSYVITTYEGTHNHMSPALVYNTSQDTTTGRFYVAGFQMPPPPGS